MHAIYYQIANQLATLTLRLATITRDNSMSAASVIRVNGRYAGSLPRSSGIEAEAKLHDIKPGSVGEKGLRTAANKGPVPSHPNNIKRCYSTVRSWRNLSPLQGATLLQHNVAVPCMASVSLTSTWKRYNAAKAKTAPSRTAQSKTELKPVRDMSGVKIDPNVRLDPHYIYLAYGAAQFPQALNERTMASLKEATNKLIVDHPGLKRPNMASRKAMIDFMVKTVPAYPTHVLP